MTFGLPGFYLCKNFIWVMGLTLVTCTVHSVELDESVHVASWAVPVAVGASASWRYAHTRSADRIVTAPDLSFRQPGTAVATITVQPGDGVGGWTGERAEVAVMQSKQGAPLNVTTDSGHEVYQVSIKLPTDWRAPMATATSKTPWGIFFQLHGPDALGASPAIALEARDDFHINLAGGDLFESGQKSWGASYAFSHGALNKGQWVELMLDVVWAADSSGRITVYRRDQGQARWMQVFQALGTPTLQYKTGQAVGTHYWKAGYYRNTGLNFKSQLQLGPIARGVNVDQMTAWSNRN